MNYNEFNVMRTKGLEVIANYIAESSKSAGNQNGNTVNYDDTQIKKDLATVSSKADSIDSSLKDLEKSVSDLQTADYTKEVRESIASLENILSGNLKLDDEQKTQIESLLKSLQQLNASTSNNAARITVVETRISSVETRISSVETRISSVETKMRGNSKTVSLDNQDYIDVFDGANFVYTPVSQGLARNLVEIKSGITGQIVNIRLNAGVTIKYDSAKIRLKNNADVVATSANQIITMVCMSGGGVSGSAGVWMEMSRNF